MNDFNPDDSQGVKKGWMYVKIVAMFTSLVNAIICLL